MIVGGLARMRAKRERSAASEIDHSILFTRDTDEPLHAVSDIDDGALQDELGELRQTIAADRSAPIAKERTGIVSEPLRESKPPLDIRPKDEPRSLFGLLRGEREKPAEVPETAPSKYRSGAPNWIIAINIVAPKGLHFTGPGVVGAAQDAGMRFGDMNIFHYKKSGAPLFSMVNGVKPGNFDLQTIDQMTTPCLSLFIQVPNQNGNNLETFDTMLVTARKIADKLGGEVRDEARNVLTKSAIDYLRQKIAEYDLKWQAA